MKEISPAHHMYTQLSFYIFFLSNNYGILKMNRNIFLFLCLLISSGFANAQYANCSKDQFENAKVIGDKRMAGISNIMYTGHKKNKSGNLTLVYEKKNLPYRHIYEIHFLCSNGSSKIDFIDEITKPS